MNTCWFAMFATLAALPLLCADDLPREVIQLARIKRQAKADLQRIPSFTCLATYERYRQSAPGAPLRRKDLLHADVLYSEGRERFGWPGSGEMDSSLGDLAMHGLASDGEFIAHAITLFVHDNSMAHYVGEDVVHGRIALRYDYRVPFLLAGYTLSVARGTAPVAMKGSFWADKETLDLLRIRVEADEIPPSLLVSEVITEVDYARTKLSPRLPLMIFPQSANVSITESPNTKARVSERNEVEYTHCREYLTSSELSFSEGPEKEPVPSGETAARPAGVREMAGLPQGLRLRMRLQTPIAPFVSLGDPIRAIVEEGPYAGAVVTGRIRVLERADHDSEPDDRMLLGLEWTDLDKDGKHARFFAEIHEADPRSPVTIARDRRPRLPGVALLYVTPHPGPLVDAGTWMDWRVVTVSRKYTP